MGKIILLYLSIFICFGKVDPPNYDFSLDTLKDFYPGAELSAIESKHGKAEFVRENKGVKIYKFYVAHIRYKFPVFVQINNNQVIDFLARLPSYFLHDVFHQSLINRFGKQDLYFKRDNQAVYVWNDKNGMRITYEGACTITCFPVYLTGVANTLTNSAETPLIKQLEVLGN
ncbi:MAG: hypothetical protein Fur0010_19850 [Bdellovibrio sp.]